jgi:hypothetical protein
MAWALSMVMTRSMASQFGRASSGPRSLGRRVTGSRRTRQMRAKPGRQTGCRTSSELNSRNKRLALNPQLWKASALPSEKALALDYRPFQMSGLSSASVQLTHNRRFTHRAIQAVPLPRQQSRYGRKVVFCVHYKRTVRLLLYRRGSTATQKTLLILTQ